jgi:hypothetical protein
MFRPRLAIMVVIALTFPFACSQPTSTCEAPAPGIEAAAERNLPC